MNDISLPTSRELYRKAARSKSRLSPEDEALLIVQNIHSYVYYYYVNVLDKLGINMPAKILDNISSFYIEKYLQFYVSKYKEVPQEYYAITIKTLNYSLVLFRELKEAKIILTDEMINSICEHYSEYFIRHMMPNIDLGKVPKDAEIKQYIEQYKLLRKIKQDNQE